MLKVLRNIAVVLMTAIVVTGCFKKVTTDTTLVIKLLVEKESGGERVAAEGAYGYIFYTSTEEWSVASYEDAVAKTITNTTTGEKRSEPAIESEPYTIEGSTNNYISMFQSGAPALVVVVYPEAEMYAYMYRKAEAENLAETFLTLIFHPWKTDVYTEGSKEGHKWTVVPNPTKKPTEGDGAGDDTIEDGGGTTDDDGGTTEE